MNSSITLSILLVTYNRQEDVRRCLLSLRPEIDETSMEVWIVDNGSTDGTPEWIETEFPSFHLISWKKNRGLAPALRYLIDHSHGEWILLLDSDTELKKDTLTTLLNFGRSHERIGAVAPRMRDMDGNLQLTARRFPSPFNSLFGRQTFLSRLWPNNPITQKYLKTTDQDRMQPFPCDWVAFAAALIRRTALEEAGSIDPEFFVYWVDADFFYRLKKKNWEVWCYPQIEVLHYEQNRVNRVRHPIAIRDFHEGAYRYYSKNHGWRGMNPFLPFARIGLWSRTQIQLLINRWRMNHGG